VAERTGRAPLAIRFYDEEGLVTPVRTGSGQQRYDWADIRWLSFVMIAQGLGFRLEEIRETLAGLPEWRSQNQAGLGKDFQEVPGRS